MVIITIGLIVIGGGLAALNDFNQKQKIEAVRQELLANLRLVRTYAITEQFSNTLTDNNKNTNVIMVVNIDSSGIMTIQAQDGNVKDTIPSPFPKDIVPDGIFVKINNNIGGSLAFSISDGRLIGGSAVVQIIGDDGTSKKINVEESGVINEK